MRRLSSIVLSMAIGITAAGTTALVAKAADESPDDYRADNTGRNVRDRDDKTLTPEDQSEKEADRKLTQKIRAAVVEDDSLSTSAHNIKIITVDGVVTLRGPVDSPAERNAINAKAVKIAGAGKVKNQLETAPKKN